MNNQAQVTPEFNPSLAVIDGTIKTTSLSVAEYFGKRHDHVLRDIKKIIDSIQGLDHAPNFGETVIERENPSGGLPIKSIAYEMDKDGFVLLVMSYNGVKAMAIKIAYIHAFNKMATELQKPQYGLKSLASPFISEAEAAQFKKSIEAFCKRDGKAYPILYRKIYEHYGITTYKNIPAGKLAEAARILGMKLLDLKKQAIPAEPFKLAFTPEELEDLVAERIKSVAGEIMPKQPEEAVQHNSVTISLAPLVDGKLRRWLVTQAQDEMTFMQSIRPDQDLRSKTEVLIDVGASKDALKELINQHIPLDLLPWLINLSSERMGDCIQTLRVTSTAAA